MIHRNFCRSSISRPRLMWSLLASLVFSVSASAQNKVVEVEIDRDASQLGDLLAGAPLPKPDIAPLLDTAMVLTSVHSSEATARCHASNKEGDIVGRVRVRIPAGGIRFFLGSDIVDQQNFVDSVVCSADGLIVGTEMLIGIATSDIDVQQDTRADASTMLFPIAAIK